MTVSAPITEVSGKLTYTFHRSYPIPPTLKVTFQLPIPGNATNGTDYVVDRPVAGPPAEAPRGEVTFDVGKLDATVNITGRFDLEVEGPEFVTVALVPGADYNTIEPFEARGTIHDYAHSTVSVSTPDNDVLEGNPGTNNPGRFMVSRDGDTGGPLTVRVRMSNATADLPDAGDYSASPIAVTTNEQTVTIATGQKSANITITPVADQKDESIRHVNLEVRPPTGTPHESTHYVESTAVAAMELDDDDRPSVTMSVPDPVATETGETEGIVTVTRVGSTTSPLPVGVIVVPASTGSFGSDYSLLDMTNPGAANGHVVIPAGSASASIRVKALNDTVREPGVPETVVLGISTDPSRYNIGTPGTGTVTLHDNDAQTINVTGTDTAAAETAANPGVVTFKRTGPDGNLPLQVLYTITGTANSTGTQTDYTVAPGIRAAGCTVAAPCKLNFTANAATATLTFTPIDDPRRENPETINVTLVVNGTQYGLGTPTLVTINLADNDAPALDTDSDGEPDVTDNCDTTPNGQSQTGPDARQNNTDADAFGDACDPDDDNDGLTDTSETTIHRTKTKARDTDGDGRTDGDEVAASTKPLDRFSPEYRVTSVRTRATGAGIEVNWTAPTGSLATRYLVFRASTPTLLAEVPATSPATYLDDKFPGDNESHTYYVQPMLPGDVGSAFNATLAGGGSAPVKMALCDAFTKDTDGDGLCDRLEEEQGTDVDKADSDGDGVSDPDELDAGTDPLDPSSGAASRFDPLEVPFLAGVLLALAVLVTLGVAIGMARRGKS